MSEAAPPAPSFSFTLDLEDHRPRADLPATFVDAAYRVLDLLDAQRVTGTWFAVGELTSSQPALLREIVGRGHEVGLHSYRHVSLDREDPATLGRELARARAALADLTGTAVRGFRAPVFSLTPATRWVVDVIAEAGFEYSSSVLPAANPLNGYPGAPAGPFRWPNGVVELPVPVAGAGPLRVPYLGGVYLRYLPLAVIETLERRSRPPAPWTYCHPYDFLADEPYFRMAGTSHLVSLLLWFNRGGTERRLSRLLAAHAGRCRPLAEVAAAWRQSAPLFAPAQGC